MTLKLKKKPTYKLEDRYQFQGLPVSVENKAGSTRKGVDPDGHEWAIKMSFDYGYIRGTTGADNEDIDVYVGPNRKAPHAYIVKQHDIGKVSQWKSEYCPKCQEHAHDCACTEYFDEDKAFIGFDNKEAAKAAYLAHYDNPVFLGPISTMRIEDFRELLTGSKGEMIDLPLQFVTDSADEMILDAATRSRKKPAVDPVRMIQQATTMNSLEAAFIAATQGPDASLQRALKPYLETIKQAASESESVEPEKVIAALGKIRLVIDPMPGSELLPFLNGTGVYEHLATFRQDYHNCKDYVKRFSAQLGRDKVQQIKNASKTALTGILYDEDGNSLESLEATQKEIKTIESKRQMLEYDLKMLDSERTAYMRGLNRKRERYMEELGFSRTYEELTTIIQQAKRQHAAEAVGAKPQQSVKNMQAYRDELYEKLEQMQQQANEQYPVWSDTESGLKQSSLYKEKTELYQQQKTATEHIGQQVIDKLVDTSPITPEEAQGWAERQKIKPSVFTRLKKQGYYKEQFLSDLAEYYRLTHGRLPSALIETKGEKRANASPDEGSIRIDDNFSKADFFHELSHLLEGDPLVRFASFEYLQERTKGEKPVWLGELTGNTSFNKNEIARPDKFFHPYMGKEYGHKLTEILSMGVQELISPERAGKLFAEDRQTFEYTVGLLTGITPEERELAAVADLKSMVENNKDDLFKTFMRALRKAMKQVDWIESPDSYRNMDATRYSLNGNPNNSFTLLDYSRKKKRQIIITHDEMSNADSVEEAKINTFGVTLMVQGKTNYLINGREILKRNRVPDWFTPGMEIPVPDKG